MKVKLLSFIFVLTFAITSFAALGVGGVSAAVSLTTPGGQCVDAPAAAEAPATAAVDEVLSHTTAPTDAGLSFSGSACP